VSAAREDAAADDGLPPGARRLFHGYSSAARGDLGLRCERLLEDGDRDDLRWLFAAHGEAAVRGWLATRGARRLSGRSRRFWALVLDLDLPAPPADPLWSR
jgi:hypothetical protein